MMVLHDVTRHWMSIGEQLYIESNELENIEINASYNNTIRLSKILQLWINQRKREVTWETIITVIQKPPLKNVKVANEICRFLLDEYNSDQQGIGLTFFTFDITFSLL